ncbi:DUF2752 domain-containing protein [Patulibacter sp. NPDC049589]|uniref:DUF2752 domain-containing protein n=1 Tax=Patulibacter sp. NPDC049589 TaxID=3154731 RepID=UPI003434F86C
MAERATAAPSREARLAGSAVALGVAALALPAAYEAAVGSDGPPICPFRLLTGLPCPFCGGTRALAAAARGDLDGALRFNAVWPVVAVALIAAGVVGLAGARRGREPLGDAWRRARLAGRRRPWGRRVAVAIAVAAPWGVGFAHRDAITERTPASSPGRPAVASTRDAAVARSTAGRHDGAAMTLVPPGSRPPLHHGEAPR